jgi:hypothetical protein
MFARGSEFNADSEVELLLHQDALDHGAIEQVLMKLVKDRTRGVLLMDARARGRTCLAF